MNRLSTALNGIGYACKIKGPVVDTVGHLLYMDDLKLYIGIPRQLNRLINIVELYTSNIKMKFGLDKYSTFNIRHGKKRTRRVKNMTRYNRVNAWN